MYKVYRTMLDRYHNMPISKKSVIWFTLAMIIQNAITFLATPVYTRVLSDSEYGIFSLYQSWQQIISIVAVIALDRCITVGFMKFEEDREGFLSAIQGLMTLSTVVILSLTIILKELSKEIMGMPLYIIIIMIVVGLMNNVLANWSWMERYNYNYKRLTSVTIMSTILTQIIAIMSVLIFNNGNKGYTLVFSMCLSKIIIYGFIYTSVWVKSKVFYNYKYWKFGFLYSIAIIPHAFAQIILNSSDRILISKYAGVEQVAYYSIAYSCAIVLGLIFSSISSALQPWFFENIKNKKYDEISTNITFVTKLMAMLATLSILVAPEIIKIMAPPSYYEAINIFPILAIGIYFNGLYLYFANFESYFEKPIYFSIATSIGAVINITLNIIFIPRWGYVAAAYTTLLCYMIFAMLHYCFMIKVCKEFAGGINPVDYRKIIGISIILVILTMIISELYAFSIVRLMILVIIIIVLVFRYLERIR